MDSDNLVAIIPARGGSKRIPNKNIKPLNNKPLIYYTISEALKSKYLMDVYVSTENEDIENLSKKYGAKIIKRPVNLADDASSSVDVIKHAINHLEKNNVKIDAVFMLQPTTPFRKLEHINGSIKLFLTGTFDSVIGVKEIIEHPYWSFIKKNNYIVPFIKDGFNFYRKQDLPKLYIVNGAVYIIKKEVIFKKNSMFGDKIGPFIMDELSSIDIDTPFQFKVAELLMRHL